MLCLVSPATLKTVFFYMATGHLGVPLLQYRMDNNLATFFTSNLNLKELEIHLSNSKNSVDEVKAKRIICRIEQLTKDIEMISKNLRK